RSLSPVRHRPARFDRAPLPRLPTPSLHDALPISPAGGESPPDDDGSSPDPSCGRHDGAEPQADRPAPARRAAGAALRDLDHEQGDRKSTRLNSSHQIISYTVSR